MIVNRSYLVLVTLIVLTPNALRPADLTPECVGFVCKYAKPAILLATLCALDNVCSQACPSLAGQCLYCLNRAGERLHDVACGCEIVARAGAPAEQKMEREAVAPSPAVVSSEKKKDPNGKKPNGRGPKLERGRKKAQNRLFTSVRKIAGQSSQDALADIQEGELYR